MNSTRNGWNCPFNMMAANTSSAIASCLIFVVSLIGNSLIVILVYKTPSLRKPINFFIANMAISDLLFSIAVTPAHLADLYLDTSLSKALCTLVTCIVILSSLVSVQSLVLIAVDRFGATVFPLRSPLISKKLCPFFILCSWIIAMAVNTPYIVFSNRIEYQGDAFCLFEWQKAFGTSLYERFILGYYVLFYYTPMAMLITLYCIIVIKLNSEKIPGEHSNSAEEQRIKRNKKVLKLAIAVVFGFVLCWIPYTVTHLMYVFLSDALPCNFYVYYSVFRFLSASNCALNPCICFMFCSKYREPLKRVVTCCTRTKL